MARRLFFVPEIRRGEARLTGVEAEHLVRVLRAQIGQHYEISDNQHLYLAEITAARKSMVTFRCVEQLEDQSPALSISIAPALFKFDRFEWMIEKVTELGATTILPFEATRTEHGLEHAAHKRLARWQRIALEASQQSRRSKLPEIHSTSTFDKILQESNSIIDTGWEPCSLGHTVLRAETAPLAALAVVQAVWGRAEP
jgi:16S rRNA (uracil1498-N3)-methyltransferase